MSEEKKLTMDEVIAFRGAAMMRAVARLSIADNVADVMELYETATLEVAGFATALLLKRTTLEDLASLPDAAGETGK